MKAHLFSLVRLVITAGLVLILFSNASGQPLIQSTGNFTVAGPTGLGPEYQISTALSPDIDRHKPAVAYNSQRDDFLVLWHYNDGSHYWIEGRTVNRQGVPMGVVGRILEASTVGIYQPAAAYNAQNNEYLIVWMKNTNGDGKTYEIWGNIFTADLVAKRSAFQIITWPNRTFWTPKAIWNSVRNEYVVIWNAFDATTNLPTDIAHATLFANGDLVGTIIITTANHPHEADLVYNPIMDEFLVVWRRESSTPGNFDIWAARVAAGTGLVVTPPGEFPVSIASEIEQTPKVATNRYDRYIVVWQKAAPGPCCDWDIYGQEVGFNSNLIGNVNVIAGSGGADETNPFVAAWPGNKREYIVGYELESSGWVETWAAFFDNGKNALDVMNMTFWLDDFGVADYAFWNVTGAIGAAGRSGVFIAYLADASGDPTVTQHVYGRFFTPYPVYLPAMRN